METMKNRRQESGRILALDAVRGLAVLGMYVQHFALNQWNSDLVSGNTMILFILCSGISYSLMAEGARRKGTDPKRLRTRILARSVIIDLAGYGLILLNGPFGVVLPAYAMLFILGMPMIGRSANSLAKLSCLLFFLSPPLMLIGLSLFSGAAVLADIAGGPLSALAWTPVFVLGMAIGKMDLREERLGGKLTAIGLAVLLPAKCFALFVLPGIREKVENWMVSSMAGAALQPDPYAVWPRNTLPVQWHMLFTDAPQGGSTFELLIGTGLSLMILGVLFFVGRGRASGILKPLAVVGKLSLTMYVLQFILAWALMIGGIDVTGLGIGGIPFGDMLVSAAVLAAGFLLSKGKEGPMESLMRRFEKMFV